MPTVIFSLCRADADLLGGVHALDSVGAGLEAAGLGQPAEAARFKHGDDRRSPLNTSMSVTLSPVAFAFTMAAWRNPFFRPESG